MKAEIDEVDIHKLVNVPTGKKKKKTKVDKLGVDKLKSVPVNLKNFSDAVSEEVLKNAKFSKLNTKVNNLETKIPDTSTSDKSIQHT